MPPSSLYCCQRSVSRISAAARNLRIAASPLPSLLDDGLSARALTAPPNGPSPAPTPTATPEAKKARRLNPLCTSAGTSVAPSGLQSMGDCVELRMSTLLGSGGQELPPPRDTAGPGSFPDHGKVTTGRRPARAATSTHRCASLPPCGGAHRDRV